jgi:serine/threonine protein kinase
VHHLSGETVAIKVIEKSSADFFESEAIVRNEIQVLQQLPKSPYIIQFFQVRLHDERKWRTPTASTSSSNTSKVKSSSQLSNLT